MSSQISAESFHRLAKSLVDSGESSSIDEALATFAGYGVRIRLPHNVTDDPAAQMIGLTAINAASRSFLGNVIVESDDALLTVRGFDGARVSDVLTRSGVCPTPPAQATQWPTISVAETEAHAHDRIGVWADGWQFGLGARSSRGSAFAPACVAAGGLAVSEAFSILRHYNPYAGKRSMVLSLWQPGQDTRGPDVDSLEALGGFWLLGLGHLGQAYAWTLGLMLPSSVPVFLQDADHITMSSLSTSMLSTSADIGCLKTRVVGAWLEARGFQTRLVERRFDEHQRVRQDEPSIALFGVDNPAARRVLESFGMRLVIDAGLGSGYHDFRALRLRTFPGPSRAADLWADAAPGSNELAPAYQQLLRDGADPCGVTTLASRAVGAPFVGCVAAGYVLAEWVRRQLGGNSLAFLDINLRNPNRIESG
jgi:hypothetical protein